MDTYGLDAVRFFLLREVPFGNDGDFSRKAFVLTCNANLAKGLGNLAQRTLSMVFKNCDGQIPSPSEFNADDKEILSATDTLIDTVRAHMDRQEFHSALEAIFAHAAAGDKYISVQEPWKLKKTDPERMQTVLYVLADVIRQLAILIQPIMPQSGAKLLDMLKVQDRDFAALGEGHRLAQGTPIDKPEGVFPQFELPAEEDE